MPKSARLAGIKSLRCYTILEAAEITGVTARTIRTWIKQGLPVLAGERPTLVRGDDLIAFIRKQRAERKTNVLLHEFFCLRCRGARAAAGGFATYRASGTRINLTALCCKCEREMNKAVSKSRLPDLGGILELISDD